MELDELKSTWKAMSNRVEQLEIITKNNIIEMTKQRYKSTFNHLLRYEVVGAVICFLMAVYILSSFNKLVSPFYVVCAIVICLFLVILPFITLSNISNIKAVFLETDSYKSMVTKFEKAKPVLLKTQQLVIPVGAIVFFISMPLFSKIMGDGAFMEKLDTLGMLFISLVFVLLMVFLYWGYKKYKQLANTAGNILKELEE